MHIQSNVGNGVTFQCGNGGSILIVNDDGEKDLSRFGSGGGFAYYDDLHLNAYNDMTIDMDGEYHVKGSLRHVTGNEVMRFNLTSQEPNGKTDVKLTGLTPDSWYRLRFNGVLAACDGGRAHGQTDGSGILIFNEVEVPNE